MGRRTLTENLLGGFPVAALDLKGARAPCALLPLEACLGTTSAALGRAAAREGRGSVARPRGGAQ